MYKKKVFIFILLIGCAVNLFSLGIGVSSETNIISPSSEENNDCYLGVSGTAKFDGQPLYYTLYTGHVPLNPRFLLTLSADWHFFEPEIKPNWNAYFGIGLGTGLEYVGGELDFQAGPRALCGMNWIFYDGFLEFFVQGVVQPTYRTMIWKSDKMPLKNANINQYITQYPISVGIRFWD